MDRVLPVHSCHCNNGCPGIRIYRGVCRMVKLRPRVTNGRDACTSCRLRDLADKYVRVLLETTADEHWMQRALALATRAEAEGEVPVGALVLLDNEIIGAGWNQPIGCNDPSAHAEMLALRDAAQRQHNYRLPGATLYVTLEPCVMCVGAIMHARIARVVYGASDPKTGAAGGQFELLGSDKFNHRVEVTRGVLAAHGAELLRNFFQSRR